MLGLHWGTRASSWQLAGFSGCGTGAKLSFGMRDLMSLTRDWTHLPSIARQSLNHWITRKDPVTAYQLFSFFPATYQLCSTSGLSCLFPGLFEQWSSCLPTQPASCSQSDRVFYHYIPLPTWAHRPQSTQIETPSSIVLSSLSYFLDHAHSNYSNIWNTLCPFFFNFFIFHWRIIALQNFVVFCQASTWILAISIPACESSSLTFSMICSA